jgi:hypothetical protein
MVICVIMGIIHLCFGIAGLSRVETLKSFDAYDENADWSSNDRVKGMVSFITEKYRGTSAPFYRSQDWLDTQEYFSCCGFVRSNPEQMTGPCCSEHIVMSSGVPENSGTATNPVYSFKAMAEGTCDMCKESVQEKYYTGAILMMVAAILELSAVLAAIILQATAKPMGEGTMGAPAHPNQVMHDAGH